MKAMTAQEQAARQAGKDVMQELEDETGRRETAAKTADDLRKRKQRYLKALTPKAAARLDRLAEEWEHKARIHAATVAEITAQVDRLPQPYKSLLRMVHINRMKQKDAAAELCYNESYLRHLYCKALEMIGSKERT